MSNTLLDVRSPEMAARYRLAGATPCDSWSGIRETESAIHRVHAYPAKFPAFVPRLALQYAREHSVRVRTVADVFCGSGTVACETRAAGLNFWGCDINPVATLVARAKTVSLSSNRLRLYTLAILRAFGSEKPTVSISLLAQARLRHWYEPTQYDDLARLLNAIREVVPAPSPYADAFSCAFSAILKSTSRWRRRATKPSLDRSKVPSAVIKEFRDQCEAMIAASRESGRYHKGSVDVQTADVRSVGGREHSADLIVTSPPYVTSYEYADLHQLSALWLGFASDYRDLRHNSIGTREVTIDFPRDHLALNLTAAQIAFSLFDGDAHQSSAVAQYHLNMQVVAQRCLSFLRPGGIAIFVIGNTKYGQVSVDNAAHLAEALLRSGFSLVRVAKRRMRNKSHTPFRDTLGRLSKSPSAFEVYADEFILMAHQ